MTALALPSPLEHHRASREVGLGRSASIVHASAWREPSVDGAVHQACSPCATVGSGRPKTRCESLRFTKPVLRSSTPSNGVVVE